MARSKGGAQAVLVQMPEASEPEIEPKTEDQRAAEDQIADSLSQAQSLAQAKIERVDKRGRKLYLGTVAPDLVTHEFLAKECGGGEYIVEYRKPSKNGASTEYSQRRRFYIDESSIPPKTPSWFQDDVGHVATAPSSNGQPHAPSMFETMALQMMTQQMQAQQAALTMQQEQMRSAAEAARAQLQMQLEMMRQQGEASRAASEQQSKMTQAFMESMRLSMSSAPKLTDTLAPFIPIVLEMLKARKDPMEIAAHIAQLMKPSGNDASTVAGALALVEKGLTIGREMAPGSGEPAGWMDLVKEGLHALPTVAATIRPNGQPVAAHVVPNPSPNGTAPTAAAPPAPLPLPAPKGVPTDLGAQHSPDMMLQATLRPIAIELQQRCDANSDPDQTADELFERYAAFRAPMLSFTNEPGYQEKLLGLFPEQLTGQAPNGMSRAPWVRRVMTELAELLREPAE